MTEEEQQLFQKLQELEEEAEFSLHREKNLADGAIEFQNKDVSIYYYLTIPIGLILILLSLYLWLKRKRKS